MTDEKVVAALKIQAAEPKVTGCNNLVGSSGCEQNQRSQDLVVNSSPYIHMITGSALAFFCLSVIIF